MKMHKIVCYVLDHERYPLSDYEVMLDQACDHVHIGETATVDIGEWTDDHDINTGKRKMASYFSGVHDLDWAVLPEKGGKWFTPDPYPWDTFYIVEFGAEATIRYSDGTKSCMSLPAFNRLVLRCEYAGPVGGK